jgi:hypothetical protein
MKTIFKIAAVAVFLVAAPSPCFALWGIAPVSRERAKELGMEVRSTAAGFNQVRVELEFKAEGLLKNFSRVDLRFGKGDIPPLTAPLQEDRSKPGRIVVSFNADRAHLDKINLWVFVPGSLGGTIYHLRVKDFVEPEKGVVKPGLDEQIEGLRTVVQELEEQKRKEQGQPAERTSPKDAKTEQTVLTPAEAIQQRPKEKVTVQFKVTAAQTMRVSKSNVIYENVGFNEVLILKDGDSFCVQLLPPAMDTIRRLGIEADKHFKGNVVQVTGLLQPGQPAFGTGQFQIVVKDLTQFEVVGE